MAADSLRNVPFERDVELAITALKKGAQLLKYGRRGKPKFCPCRLSNDESVLIWYSGKVEKQLKLNQVSKVIPGQRTAIFQRYPRPEKEYQSFSLIYGERSLDLICKDKDEAETWFVGLKALISRRNSQKLIIETTGDKRSDSPNYIKRNSPLTSPFSSSDVHKDPDNVQHGDMHYESRPVIGFGNLFSDVILYTAPQRSSFSSELVSNSNFVSSGGADTSNGRVSGVDSNVRFSYSSAVSSSSYGSGHDDFDSLGDILIWGEGIGDGMLGGGYWRGGSPRGSSSDASLPKPLDSTVLLDVHSIACGSRHSVLVTKQGEIYSWGEESGGRLGHGVDADVSHPKLINVLSGTNIELVACGEFHTCAVSFCGDLYTWGDGIYNSGILGHGNEASHWIPKKVCGQLEGLHVSSVSCGPWHTAVVASSGQLFTFGDGVFGALGHGDRQSTNIPREVDSLKGMRTVRAACGVWHTAAIVEVVDSLNSGTSSGKIFTWGDGDKGRLGHSDREPRLIPACVASLFQPSFCQVACGHDITVALTTSGRVYTMGSAAFGQLESPKADGKLPIRVGGRISTSFIEEIACGSHHVAVLTSKTQVYTWGRGANGRLGHGDNDDRNTPTLVEALKDKQVKSVVCGTSFTAAICLHKWISGLDQSVCSGCRLPFNFRRKRHNCYNCGLGFCKACSSRKSLKASLAPNMCKPYRVCDECYTKLKTAWDGKILQNTKLQNGNLHQMSSEVTEKDAMDKKLHVRLSRLPSVESCKGESKHPRRSNSRLPPLLNQLGNLHASSTFLFGSSKKKFSASVPATRVGSRSTSPMASRPSPPHPINMLATASLTASEIAYSYQSNENLSEEVARLRSQVEELTHKSELLEAELDKTTNQLREARAIADEESSKCKAAKEVMSSLSTQLKEMAERVPEGCTINNNWSRPSELLGNPFCGNFLPNLSMSRPPDSNVHLARQLPCNGNSIMSDTEWVEQVEHGVYITVFSSSAGHKYLRRVRFSRRCFTEQQAERWWAEHLPMLRQKYSILTGDSVIPSSRTI